jgi:large subunit ribosomal protein L4
MKLTVKDKQGNAAGELEVQFPIIENQRATQVVHETIVAYRAAQRSGTACTKTMGEVQGTGKKPWRQKGTGRARAGSFASPLWRGGGVVFGPKPRDFRKKVMKSAKQMSLQKAMSERLKAGDVVVVDDLKLEVPKTKELVKFLAALQVTGTVLVVIGQADANLRLAARNVPEVELAEGISLNTYQVLRSDKLILTRGAFEQVEQRLLKS